MKLHNRPTADLVHQAIHAMTEELALFSVKEFLNRSDASIQMFYKIIEGSRYEKVKHLAGDGLLRNKSAVAGDFAWLATNTTSDDVALKAVWALVHLGDVSAYQWEKVGRRGHSAVVRLRAQERLVGHDDATESDLLWLSENGENEPVRGEARMNLSLLSGKSEISDQKMVQWITALARMNKRTILCQRAQEALAKHEHASLKDLLWLDENGLTDEIRSAARLEMSTRI